jgi:hypothetical protein
MTWAKRFTDIMAFMRRSGWNRIFIMRREHLSMPGMTARRSPHPDNDNRSTSPRQFQPTIVGVP